MWRPFQVQCRGKYHHFFQPRCIHKLVEEKLQNLSHIEAVTEKQSKFSPEYELGHCEPRMSTLPACIQNALTSLFKSKLIKPYQTQSHLFLHCLGYPRSFLKPDVQRILDLNKEACQIKAEYYITKDASIKPDELPKTTMEYGDRESMAYLAWQMPFAYGCLERIFSEIRKRIPTFSPKNIFDFGIGPGTAVLYENNGFLSSKVGSID